MHIKYNKQNFERGEKFFIINHFNKIKLIIRLTINYLYSKTRKENFIFTIIIDIVINIHTDNHFVQYCFHQVSIWFTSSESNSNKLINISQMYIIK